MIDTPNTKRKFAVFDIDGTIVRNGLFVQIMKELIARDHLPVSTKAAIDEKFERYRTRLHDDAYREYVREIVDVFLNHIGGVSVPEYHKTVDEIVTQSQEAIYVYTRDLAKRLKQEGYVLIALSGSEMYSVQKFTKPLGFDIVKGETYHEKDGTFTGKVDMVAYDKKGFLSQLITEHNLDTHGSIGIGDTQSDIGMLEIVDNPIAFNPDRTLFEHAKEQGWKIVIERKNTIITLEQTDGIYCLA